MIEIVDAEIHEKVFKIAYPDREYNDEKTKVGEYYTSAMDSIVVNGSMATKICSLLRKEGHDIPLFTMSIRIKAK